jgi:outer membrane protein TolC
MKGQPLLAILLALAGCTVGPDYTAPRLPTPTGFAESQGPQATRTCRAGGMPIMIPNWTS